MHNREAKRLLRQVLDDYCHQSYSDLAARVGTVTYKTVTGESGIEYQLEVQSFWNGKPDHNIIIVASIDDGGWRVFMPLTETRVVSFPQAPQVEGGGSPVAAADPASSSDFE